MQLGSKGGALIAKNGRLTSGCGCCGCPAQCTDLSSEIEISVSAPANSGTPWVDTSDVLLIKSASSSTVFRPAMYGQKSSISVSAISDSVIVPAASLSPSTQSTSIAGSNGQISATVFGCTVSVSVTQTTNASLVWADTYYSTDNNGNPITLLATKGEPVKPTDTVSVPNYEAYTKETRSATMTFSLSLWREVQLQRYWRAMDTAFFPSTVAWNNQKVWVSATSSGVCSSYEADFTLTETTTGYLQSVKAGDEYNGVGLPTSWGKQIRILEDISITLAIR